MGRPACVLGAPIRARKSGFAKGNRVFEWKIFSGPAMGTIGAEDAHDNAHNYEGPHRA